MIKIRRNSESTGNPQYLYVDDGEYLRPLHAVARTRSRDLFYEYYFFDDGDLKGKKVVEFSFSNMGFVYAKVYSSEDFNEEGAPKPMSGKKADPRQFCNRVYVEDTTVRSLTEYYFKYMPMADYVKRVFEDKAVLMGKGKRIIESIETGCPIGCVIQYKGSETCLSVVKRWVFSLWLASLIMEAVGSDRIISQFGGRPCVWVEQNRKEPNLSFSSPFGEFSVWIEPPLYLTRPSLLVVKEGVSLNMSIGRGVVVHNIDVADSLDKIMGLFKPKALIAVSLGDIPKDVGIGNLTVKNEEGVKEFKVIVSEALKSLNDSS
ncbi:MAG: hypothetical protein MPF33_02325 [Candidatus Aramenus sp.]|jgi:hypothetical protein|nr:hypothetical protein [Candidatus Aramenus sp.]